MKLFKKLLTGLTVAGGLLVVGCGKTTTTTQPTTTVTTSKPTQNTTGGGIVLPDSNPVIFGAEDVTVEKGTVFKPKEGVTAFDKEDGELTSSITVKGSVNYNVVGTYKVTYTVYDSDGNKATVERTVSVVFTDKQAPMITGVADKNIVIGATFDALEGVTSTDIVDGNLSSSIQVEGSVDVWTEGTYTLKYISQDNAGNKAEATRTITVTLGDFGFGDNVLGDAQFTNGQLSTTVSSGAIDKTLCAYGLAQFTFTASGSGELTFSIAGATSQEKVQLTSEAKEYTVYFRLDEAVEDAAFVVSGDATLSNYSLKFGFAKDTTAPVISVPANYSVVLPGNLTDEAVLKKFILNGITAQDDIDQNVTYLLDVDFGSLELGNVTGVKTLSVFVADKAGNETTQDVEVEFTNVYDTGIIKNPEFNQVEEEEQDPWALAGGGGNPTLEFKDGTMVHTVVTGTAGWDSASSPVMRYQAGSFKAGNWYMLKFDAKATVARYMTVRIGLDTTEALGWIENFNGASNYPINLTTEMTTYYVLFYVHADKSQGGMNTIKLELKLGTHYWNNEQEIGNPVTIDNLQYYLLSNQDNAPEITPVKGLPTTFGVNEVVDFKQYITAYDLEDGGNIEITDSMVDLSGVDMTKPGNYVVKYNVTDTNGTTTSYEFTIKVIAEKDTQAPVITVNSSLPTRFEEAPTDLDLTKYVSVVDNVDGEMVVAKSNIIGSLNYYTSEPQTITYRFVDTSGNEATQDIVFTFVDTQAPVITGEDEVVLEYNEKVDLTKLVTVKDNFDGDIKVTLDNISGYEDFLFDNRPKILGTYTLVYTFTDNAGNTATKSVKVTVEKSLQLTEGGVVASQSGLANGNTAASELTTENGVTTIKVTDVGTWASYAHVKLNISSLIEGQTYKLKITAKADKERSVEVKMGKSLGVDPWYEYYTVVKGSNNFNITTEYETYEIIFTVSATDVSTAYIEFRYGATGGSNVAAGNNIYITQFDVVQLISEVLVEDEVVLNALEPTEGEDGPVYPFVNGAATASSISYTDSEATITVVDPGQWASAAHLKLNITSLEYGQTYRLKMVLKADQARKVEVKMGKSLGVDPWYEFYSLVKGANQFEITDTYETYEIDFKVDVEDVSLAYLEFRYGKIGGSNEVGGNNIYVQSFEIYSLKKGEALADDAEIYISEAGLAVAKQVSLVEVGANIEAQLAQILAETTIFDNGTIVPVTMDMVDLNGLNPQNVQAGSYNVVISYKGISNRLVSNKIVVVCESNELPEGAHEVAITGANQGGTTYTFSADYKSVTLGSFGTGPAQWGRWNFNQISTKYGKATVTFIGGKGISLCVRFDNASNGYNTESKVKYIALEEGKKVVEFDFAALGIDSTSLVKFIFMPYDKTGTITSGSFQLVNIVFSEPITETEPEQPEVQPGEPVEVKINNITQGGSDFSYTNGSNVVNCVKLTTSTGQWGRYNFSRVSTKAVKAVAVFKGSSNLNLLVKLDSNEPNNTYDSVSGNKQYFTLKGDEQVITVEWDLTALNMNSTILDKLVFWAKTVDGANTAGSFELVSLTFYPAA